MRSMVSIKRAGLPLPGLGYCGSISDCKAAQGMSLSMRAKKNDLRVVLLWASNPLLVNVLRNVLCDIIFYNVLAFVGLVLCSVSRTDYRLTPLHLAEGFLLS